LWTVDAQRGGRTGQRHVSGAANVREDDALRSEFMGDYRLEDAAPVVLDHVQLVRDHRIG